MAPVDTARAKKYAAFEEKHAKDYDPEVDASVEDGSGSEQEEDAAATEHYVSVGKSKLRQKEAPALGPKYSGVRVSRSALDDSDDGMPDDDEEDSDDAEDSDDSQEYDDPDAADLDRDNIIDDEEIDSDEAFGEGEEDVFRNKGFSFKDSKKASQGPKAALNGRSKRAVAADFMSGSEEEELDHDDAGSDSAEDDESAQLDGSETEEEPSGDEGSSAEDGSDDDSEDSEEDDDEDDDEDEDEDEDEEMGGTDTKDDRSGIRNLMQEGQKSVVATISQAAKADAEKGVAVRQQRRTYDSLLNLRIRLQKGIVAVNSLGEATDTDSADKEPYEAAEEAAIKLWNAIDGFRASLLPEPKAGQKRKRDIDSATSNEELWADMQATEHRAAAKRKKVLDKWSNRVKSTTTTMNKTRQLGAAAGSQSLISVLEDQLLNSERLVKRTHVPRSCAPVQAARKVAEDPDIYDDADFYQLLLKELVDQRTSDTAAGGDSSVPTVRWTAIKEAKTRKQVDRRASKGRKLRFTVHEKLQNFMAPEDRRSWEEEAIDRLFGTLFGQKMQLKEEVSDDEEEGVAEEEGLKLFRS
ncbi:rRNA-processing protein bfr2 [Cytospora paraplurivora]|uniref:Protein BFR2 n=1 Tax=Cytospora paraplurivora TaxID=2898453 RepID=A0AAN9U657_9PEZI